MRRSFQSVRLSRIPAAIGLCASDTNNLLSYVNAATERLIIAGGEAGFWGTWDRVTFAVTRTNPFVIAPYGIARIINMDVCRLPIKIQNPFFEVLEYGIGWREGTNQCLNTCQLTQGYDRGVLPFLNPFTPGLALRIFTTEMADVGKRIFIKGTDTNGIPLTSMDNGVVVPGIFVVLDMPYVDTPTAFNTIDSVQKDVTIGAVPVYQINADSSLTLLARYAPNQQYPCYRKYFLGGLPSNCCGGANDGILQLESLCKREFEPYTCDMDELLIGNLEALKHECQAIRYGEMDSPTGKQESAFHHKEAIRLLNEELDHYLGKERPAVNFAPFGGGTPRAQMIGQLF